MAVWLKALVESGKNTTHPSPTFFEPFEPRTYLSVGGGFTDAGIHGEYFANASLSGPPSFTRQDVRVDFDWGANGAPGGSIDGAYAQVGADNHSVRWSGRLVAAFSETYVFGSTSTGGVRLSIKPVEASAWTTVIDDWSNGQATLLDAGSYAMEAGRTYDIRLEYSHTTGPAMAKLHWQSPSTPEEVIEPLSISGINAVTYNAATYADAMKMGRDEWALATAANAYGALAPRDANGWPMSDATNIVWEGTSGEAAAGTYLLRFNGKARVSAEAFGPATFAVDGVTYSGSLPSGVGYDPVTNTTSATLTLSATNAGILYLTFLDSQRTAASPVNTGVTSVKLMRPTAPGASTHNPLGTVFNPLIKEAYARFTTERWLTANFDTAQVNWSDRKLPGYSTANFSDRNAVWEYEVMLANETGKDLYITIPMNASPDYVAKLANLIRFGSDGVNPYPSQQANPVYSGLNSNLRLYVEWGNENWNWSFSQAGTGYEAAKQAVQDNIPDGQIINYDGQFPGGDFRRWSALKTVQASNAFRGVWGDAAMGDRVRVLLEYQYDDYQGTASTELSFLDHYFNNADGIQHVATPRPVSYYIWGGGGAVYFGAPNSQGYQDSILVPDAGFESTLIPLGTAQPRPFGAWAFTGDAGVYANNTDAPAVSGQSLGVPQNSGTSAVGYRFTVGDSPINVYQLGRWVAPGNSRFHEIHIIRESDRADVANVVVNLEGAAAGQYKYTTIGHPVTLGANTSYFIVSTEADGQDAYYDQGTSLTNVAGITINHAVSVVGGNYVNGTAGAHGPGPVNFTFTTNQEAGLGAPPDAPEGAQAAFIGGTGTMTTAVDFTSTGVFALGFSGANKHQSANAIRIYVDDTEVTPNGNNYVPQNAPWTPGSQGWSNSPSVYDAWSSAPFTISTTGQHVIRVVGAGASDAYTYLDNVHLLSLDAIFASGMPGNGQANGQPEAAMAAYQKQLDSQAKYAQAYGLRVVAYEGGWSLGGDNGDTPLQNFARYVDPRGTQATLTSINDFAQSGGSLYVFGTYYSWPGTGPTGYWPSGDAAGFPIPLAIDAANDLLPPDPTNGASAPSGLSVAQPTWSVNSSNGTLGANGWLDWNILIPTTGVYDLAVTTTTGGTLRFTTDDANTVLTATSGGQLVGSMTLTKGLHTLKVRNTGGAFAVTSAAVTPHGAPLPPGGLAVILQNNFTTANLTWGGTTPDQTGYKLYRATDPLFTQGLVVTPLASDIKMFTDSGLDPSKTYYYAVRAVVPGGESANSNVVSLPALVESVATTLTDPGFEIPALGIGQYQHLPAGSAWIFQGHAGIQSNGSAWGAANAPGGTQTAFLQGNGTPGAINQFLSLNGGAYQVSFQAARRNGQVQPIRFSVDGVQVGGLITPAGNAFAPYTTAVFTVAPGVHALRFEATNNAGDFTSFIDLFSLVEGVPASTPPTVASAASATANPVNGTSVTLSVLGADDGGETNLTYTWAAIGNPPAPVAFGANGTHASRSTPATFTKAGVYQFQATITDAGGQSTTSAVTVTVNQTLTSITVSPSGIALAAGETRLFAATGRDQFGEDLANQPSFTWSVVSGGVGGTMNSVGLYTAPSGVGGGATVRAASSGVSATARVIVAPSLLENGWFEAPSLGAGQWKFAPTGGSWTFGGNAGIQSNGSAWGAANAPTGTQTAMLQSNGNLGSISQTLNLSAGSYRVVLQAARRNGQLQPLRFTVDGQQVGDLIAPASNAFAPYTTASFTVTAGVHTIAFEATDNAQDRTTFVDAVAVVADGPPPASAPPTIGNAAAASVNPVNGTGVALSVLGADDGGEASLTYTWTVVGNPPAPVALGANGTNAAKATTASFTKAGVYNFVATITDAGGLAVTSAVSVTVNQTLTSITVSPTGMAIQPGETQPFTAAGRDQFGAAMADQPTVVWSVEAGGAGGSINASGLYLAPSGGEGGADTVRATSGAIVGTASLSVGVPAASGLANGDFEAPSLGAAQWNFAPAGSDWTFTGHAGIESNGSAWGAANAPSGTQAAVLQGNGNSGTISQAVALAGGTYKVTFQAARRGGQAQPIRFTVDGVAVGGLITPAGNAFAAYTTELFTVTPGSHTLGFAATDGSMDRTSFIDAISLVSIVAPPSSPPAIAAPASVTSPVTGSTTNLSVLGTDDGGEANLIYTWVTTGTPPAPVVFSVNGNNGAKNTVATFAKAGTYVFQVTVVDLGGQSATSGVSVTVDQTLTRITVSPAAATIAAGATRQLAAVATDQFGNALNEPPAIAWSVVGGGAGGAVNASGLYTAPAAGGANDTIRAASGAVSGTAAVSVAASGLSNGSFESPGLGAGHWQFRPSGGAWSFTGNAGIERNGSAWGAPSTPSGTQAAFLQSNGSPGAISQAVTLGAGTYQLTFQAARRNGQVQPLRFSVDGVQVGGLIAPTSNNFALYTTVIFTVTSGAHTLRLEATDNSADLTTFLDAVSLVTV